MKTKTVVFLTRAKRRGAMPQSLRDMIARNGREMRHMLGHPRARAEFHFLAGKADWQGAYFAD